MRLPVELRHRPVPAPAVRLIDSRLRARPVDGVGMEHLHELMNALRTKYAGTRWESVALRRVEWLESLERELDMIDTLDRQELGRAA